MTHRPSIKDIARIADVDPSTVSRALAGSTRVSLDTRQRVRAIANDIGYTPSVAARSLVTGASQTFGIIAPSLGDPYAAAVIRGIEVETAAAGYRLVVASTGGDPAKEVESLRLLAGQPADGLIVLSSRAGQAYRDLLPTLGAPLVFINSDQPGDHIFSIATDNEYGGWLATSHLLDLGHRSIAYVGGPGNGRSQRARAAGYRRALVERGIPFRSEMILAGDGSIAAGRSALTAILARPKAERVSAVFCYNDLSALGLLAEAHQHGISIPGDLSVVGFDNVPYAELSLPPLTTVEQRTEDLGRLAVRNLLDALNGLPVSDIHLRGDLIVRSSASSINRSQ
ncbi:MAG: LacI family DNA-binding transcriptional regulator [Caldilineales bacterium]|nr:LacI family DNA-binding transcriptional regulator [Caldilineales bacterium]